MLLLLLLIIIINHHHLFVQQTTTVIRKHKMLQCKRTETHKSALATALKNKIKNTLKIQTNLTALLYT